MPTQPSRVLAERIEVPLDRAYDFAHRPDNFMQWAAGLSRSLHRTDRGWVADTPAGEALVEFSPRNDFGVLDHRVRIAGQSEVYIPLRMIASGDGTEVQFTLLRQPEMTDAMFEADAAAVKADLRTLKDLLEARQD